MKSILILSLFALESAISMPAHAEQLGRLFYTPEQRAQFDLNYDKESATDNNSNSVLMLNGIVQKQGGKRTVWINGVPQQDGSSDEKAPDSLLVPLPGQNKSVKLKVGQRVLLTPSTSTATTRPDTPDVPEP